MLYGSNFEQEGDIDSWLEFALHEARESRESREYVVGSCWIVLCNVYSPRRHRLRKDNN